jgi:hypothetical protein
MSHYQESSFQFLPKKIREFYKKSGDHLKITKVKRVLTYSQTDQWRVYFNDRGELWKYIGKEWTWEVFYT